MDKFDLERDDRITDERDESLKSIRMMTIEEIKDEYNLKIDFYGLKDSSEEFNYRIEELATAMRLERDNPDFKKITPEIRASSVYKLDEKIESSKEITNMFRENITVKDYIEKIEKAKESYPDLVKAIDEDGKEHNLYSILRYNYIGQNREGDYKVNDEKVLPNDSLLDCLKMSLKFEPYTREEIINRYEMKEKSLETVLIEKYSKKDEVRIEREKNEGLLDSLMKIYEAKGLRDPNLKYGLEHYIECENSDRFAQTYVNAFIKSLSVEERMSLIPRNKEESMEIVESRRSIDIINNLYRPIYGFANLNHEMIDRMSDSLQGSKCVELGCGNGMLSRMLQDRNIDVTPVDMSNDKTNKYEPLQHNQPATEIIYKDAVEYIRETDEKYDYVILSWPPYNNPMASDICEILLEKSPDTQIIYIGEPRDGCTADYEFFELTKRSYDQKGFDKANDAHCSYLSIYDNIELRDLKNK